MAGLGRREAGSCPNLASLIEGEPPCYPSLYRALVRYGESLPGPLRLCGLSLGAVLALQYAADYPQRVDSLVLLAPQFRMPRALLRVQNAVFSLLPESAFSGAGLSKKGLLALTASMAKLDLTGRLAEIRQPALVVCGTRDFANRRAAAQLARRLPNASLHWLQRVGHEINRQAPQELIRLLQRWEPPHILDATNL